MQLSVGCETLVGLCAIQIQFYTALRRVNFADMRSFCDNHSWHAYVEILQDIETAECALVDRPGVLPFKGVLAHTVTLCNGKWVQASPITKEAACAFQCIGKMGCHLSIKNLLVCFTYI